MSDGLPDVATSTLETVDMRCGLASDLADVFNALATDLREDGFPSNHDVLLKVRGFSNGKTGISIHYPTLTDTLLYPHIPCIHLLERIATEVPAIVFI